jgi:hypothetical protein
MEMEANMKSKTAILVAIYMMALLTPLIPLSAQPLLDVTLSPIHPPIVIPAQGGQFQFNLSVVNHGPAAPFILWAWVNPHSPYSAPNLGPMSLNPPPNVLLTRLRYQAIPGSWQSGPYTYVAYVNTTYNYPPIDSSSFPFTKLTGANGDLVEWKTCVADDPFPEEIVVPSTHSLVSISPNPFNPTTALSYELRAASHVFLKVYDASGRMITTLVDGWREAGVHEVTFDGSKLASGMYLYRLQVGGETKTGKMMLLK